MIGYAGLALLVVGLTAVARAFNPLIFRRLIGDANPIAAAMGVSALAGGNPGGTLFAHLTAFASLCRTKGEEADDASADFAPAPEDRSAPR